MDIFHIPTHFLNRQIVFFDPILVVLLEKSFPSINLNHLIPFGLTQYHDAQIDSIAKLLISDYHILG
jgi:hypothetical protein